MSAPAGRMRVPSPAPRLAFDTLARLPAGVQRPDYDPRACAVGIVHLGVGNFHRAHQAVYTDAVLHRSPGWAISGVSLRRPDMRDALAPQDGLYTLLEHRADAPASLRVIGSLRECRVAPDAPWAVVERLADPAIRVVSLTVTEKGYARRADGTLDESDAAVHHDLGCAAQGGPGPRSVWGLLHEACALRQRRGAAGFALVSCDNLSHNGDTTRALLRQYAALRSAAVARWIEASLSFPNGMVDRIVPHTTPELRDGVQGALGLHDAWPVGTESFTQWVLEDRFVAGRPPWELAGVEFVDDVTAAEAMKLRLLNAAHSLIAYLGVPDDLATVDAAVGRPVMARFIDRFWHDEAIAALPPAWQPRALAYVRDLMPRFANPSLAHRTLQIASDGSQKLPLRWWPTLRERLNRGQSVEGVAIGTAAWIRYLHGVTRAGLGYEVVDPIAGSLCRVVRDAGEGCAAQVDALMSLPGVIDADLAADARWRAAVSRHLEGLMRHGSVGWLARIEADAQERRS